MKNALKESLSMKKILALVSFLIVVAACTMEPTKELALNTNAPVASKSTAAPSEAEMTALEKSTWELLKKKDYNAFGNLLASDYLEVGEDGVWDKPGIVTYLRDLNLTDATFSDWKMLPIDSDAVILTYNANLKGTFKGTEIPSDTTRVASVWVNRAGKWQAFFYQETRVKAATPSPSPPTANKPAAATASPAAKPAEAGPDPIANEKLVWDTFKSRNYDAFAAMLAPEFTELAPDAVYDKAGTVKGVAQFDASKFVLSDWKSAKLNDDASRVTYLVKASAPMAVEERHSTIWVNRGGKWLALLHVGTPVAKPAAQSEKGK